MFLKRSKKNGKFLKETSKAISQMKKTSNHRIFISLVQFNHRSKYSIIMRSKIDVVNEQNLYMSKTTTNYIQQRNEKKKKKINQTIKTVARKKSSGISYFMNKFSYNMSSIYIIRIMHQC